MHNLLKKTTDKTVDDYFELYHAPYFEEFCRSLVPIISRIPFVLHDNVKEWNIDIDVVLSFMTDNWSL